MEGEVKKQHGDDLKDSDIYLIVSVKGMSGKTGCVGSGNQQQYGILYHKLREETAALRSRLLTMEQGKLIVSMVESGELCKEGEDTRVDLFWEKEDGSGR